MIRPDPEIPTYSDRQAVDEDLRLQADPELGAEGRVRPGQILIAAIGAIAIVIATFYGIMHSGSQQTASAPPAAETNAPPATKQEAKQQEQGPAQQTNQPGSNQPGGQSGNQAAGNQQPPNAQPETTGAAPAQSGSPPAGQPAPAAKGDQRGQQKK